MRLDDNNGSEGHPLCPVDQKGESEMVEISMGRGDIRVHMSSLWPLSCFQSIHPIFKQMEWYFNLWKAPWWGGFFKRLVKSTKRCLKRTIG